MAGKAAEPSVPDTTPMTFRDYPGAVEASEPVQVTTVFLPVEPTPTKTEAAKPAKKEN